MADYFFPGCRQQKACPDSSKRLIEYVERKLNLKPFGCCRVKRQLLTAQDKAIIVCNNCAAGMVETSNVDKIEFIWQIIDEDDSFVFPDYKGETIALQE